MRIRHNVSRMRGNFSRARVARRSSRSFAIESLERQVVLQVAPRR